MVHAEKSAENFSSLDPKDMFILEQTLNTKFDSKFESSFQKGFNQVEATLKGLITGAVETISGKAKEQIEVVSRNVDNLSSTVRDTSTTVNNSNESLKQLKVDLNLRFNGLDGQIGKINEQLTLQKISLDQCHVIATSTATALTTHINDQKKVNEDRKKFEDDQKSINTWQGGVAYTTAAVVGAQMLYSLVTGGRSGNVVNVAPTPAHM